MKFIDEISFQGQRVLMRVDFNVPLDYNSEVAGDNRLRAALPSIHHILAGGGRLVLCSHLGRPGGKPAAGLSLKPVARRLGKLLKTEIPLAPDCVGPQVAGMVRNLKDGEVLLLENLRFHPGEAENSPQFAAALARLADIYVNDAFAVSHRRHASIVSVPMLTAKQAAGFLIQREIRYCHQAMQEPARPFIAIIGGAKVSSKLQMLENLLAQVDRLIIGGAMANTFLKARGLDMGASLVEPDLVPAASALLDKAKRRGVKVYLPLDCVIGRTLSRDSPTKTVPVRDIPNGWMALDIGPSSVKSFTGAIRSAKTIVWNGPLGAFELEPFRQGTVAIAQEVGTSLALTIIGGGDTGLAVQQAGETENMSYISTGGGAFLRFLEGGELPGLAALH